MDTISLRSLTTQAIIGLDSWGRPNKPQPIILSIYVSMDTASAARGDSIAHTFSYGTMAKDVLGHIANTTAGFTSIDNLTYELARMAVTNRWPFEMLRIVACAPKALLRATGGLERELCLQRPRAQDVTITLPSRTDGQQQQHQLPHQDMTSWHVPRHFWRINSLRVACIIGVNEHERLEKQDVVIWIRVTGYLPQDSAPSSSSSTSRFSTPPDLEESPEIWRELVHNVCSAVEPTSFLTLEALAALVANCSLHGSPFSDVTVRVEKPSAVTFAEGAGVEITRDRAWLERELAG